MGWKEWRNVKEKKDDLYSVGEIMLNELQQKNILYILILQYTSLVY